MKSFWLFTNQCSRSYHLDVDPESGYLFSIWWGSGAGSDLSVWCGSQSGSCSSSKWWESPTTGLQVLYYCIFSLHASIVSVHDPPRLYFEPPQLLSCQLCLGSQPGRTPTLPTVCGSKGAMGPPPPSATRHLGGGGGGAVMYPPTHVVMWTPLHTVPCYVNSTTASKSQCMSMTIYAILCHVFHFYVPPHVYMMSTLLVASVHVYTYHLPVPTQHFLPVLWNPNYFLRFRFGLF